MADKTKLPNVRITRNSDGSYWDMVDMIHPVGSLYMTESRTSPSEIWGGTWELIASTTGLNETISGVGDYTSVKLEDINLSDSDSYSYLKFFIWKRIS